ncbi:MAG: methyltransferase domain-containing protein [Chromatiaceae bacterium]
MPTNNIGSPRHCAGRIMASLVAALLTLTNTRAEPADQEPRAVSPELNTRFLAADVTRWQNVFERPGREVFDQRFRIVQATGVGPGMRVADVGAGTGLFTMLFARAVGPTGKVYAVDISKSFVADIERRAAAYHVDNVETILSKPKDTLLPSDGVDLVFVCDTYHHFEYPQAMLASIGRALRPGGELVIVDFRHIPGVSTPWVLSHVRAGQDEVTKEVKAAGFDLVDVEHFLRTNYFVRFRKKSPR